MSSIPNPRRLRLYGRSSRWKPIFTGVALIRNKHDKDGSCFTRGNEAVEKFVECIQKDRFFRFERFATEVEDYKEHWDIMISYLAPIQLPCFDNYNEWRVHLRTEVKAMKKVRRSDEAPTDETFVIEIKGVQPQNKNVVNHGWLWGMADAFAFEMTDSFWVISGFKLRNRIKELGELYNINFDAEPDLGKGKKSYKLYGRAGRGDKFIYVAKHDIAKCEPWEIKK